MTSKSDLVESILHVSSSSLLIKDNIRNAQNLAKKKRKKLF